MDDPVGATHARSFVGDDETGWRDVTTIDDVANNQRRLVHMNRPERRVVTYEPNAKVAYGVAGSILRDTVTVRTVKNELGLYTHTYIFA